MSMTGRFTPDRWGSLMPVHSSFSHRAPFYYRDTEMVMVTYETDPEVCLDLLPPDMELVEPATAFMVLEQNHWTTLGPYGEVYVGFIVNFQGETMAYVPGVYVTGENSQLLGREIWGFGKKRMHSFEIKRHDNAVIEVKADVLPDDGAIRCRMRPEVNQGPESLASMPLICLKVIPDAEGGQTPSLAQLVAVEFAANPIMGTDGKAEIYSGPGEMSFGVSSDISLPIINPIEFVYARFNADLPYGRILKTYTKDELK